MSLFNIEMRFVRKPKDEPYWIVEFPSEVEVKLLASRSVSLRNCIELWAHAPNVQKLHEELKLYPKSLMQPYVQADKSFKIEVDTFCKHFSQKEKVDKLEAFSYLPVDGPVDLKTPDVTFQYIEYYGIIPHCPPEQPYEVFFGRWVASGLRQLIKKLSLKTRKFIGNTSMDPQLSLLMANQAKVTDGSLVVDPFVGSGSLLVAATQFGGYVWGTDIDYLMLHGRTRPSRIHQKTRDRDESVRANMKQYNMEHRYMDVLVNDFATPFWREDFRFDAVITDPPYGIREATERVGTKKEGYEVKAEHLPTHIPAKIEYGISNIYKDLLRFSARHLRVGGRLVCWFPVFREDYTENVLPHHPCLELVSNSEQTLSKVTSRRLLTFEKTREPTEDELDEYPVDIMDFREKYFVIREESRKERRMKEAKIREDDRLRNLNKQS
ncbi:unnamed protein product [Acanthoscelides obtectus]|uniref:tRNA (guanine(10)-N(2))-methyltransferase TRMT11 n=2 Tax=Acanthoscelides obtectus TaxID=200917 RepID=A0A9P0KP17_ACAOB|nr:unnamed protein product [Acanthoscelides obtectus]CAK1639561.1 tRNA (guanine(10)-N2)-methyltransferase homolog [Acanthoscelides obtectus]